MIVHGIKRRAHLFRIADAWRGSGHWIVRAANACGLATRFLIPFRGGIVPPQKAKKKNERHDSEEENWVHWRVLLCRLSLGQQPLAGPTVADRPPKAGRRSIIARTFAR
jgi:hypothetical protein